MNLSEARGPDVGGKAAPLGRLLRAGFAVPEGFVLPAAHYRRAAADLGLAALGADRAHGADGAAEARRRLLTTPLPAAVADAVGEGLARLHGVRRMDDAVAVRSSAMGEDGAGASAAGQHESVLDVHGVDRVCHAVRQCWASWWSERAVAYRARTVPGDMSVVAAEDAPVDASGDAPDHPPVEAGGMAVLVQRLVDAEVSGVMFTSESTLIEATRGSGEPLVAGRVTPEAWRVGERGILEHRAGHPGNPGVSGPSGSQEPCLAETDVLRLHALGRDVAALLGGQRDIEWALADGRFWILQARPVTSALPKLAGEGIGEGAGPASRAGGGRWNGVPASPGAATGTARVVRGPGDFAGFRPGDVLVCRDTDPAWTPLFAHAAAVVTETGGVLSHAAIVAREVGIPAVLAVPRATDLLAGGPVVTVDGDAGWVAWQDGPDVAAMQRGGDRSA